MGNSEQRLFTMHANEWPVSEIQRSRVVEFFDDIKDRQSLFEGVCKTGYPYMAAYESI
jgi:hypothetical protein